MSDFSCHMGWGIAPQSESSNQILDNNFREGLETRLLQNLAGVLGMRLVLNTYSSTHRVCTQLCNGGCVQWVLGYRYDDARRFLVTHAGKQKILYPVATSVHQVHILPVTWDAITVGYELCNMFPDDGYATRV